MDSVHSDRLAFVAGRSVAIIQQNQTPSGAYLASPNFPVYRYSWFRDGAFIADAMSRAGHTASADAFFGWCSRVITARAAQIEGLIARGRSGAPIAIDEHLHARYSADGTDAGDQWWNFQLDGYGAWLWSLGAHVDRHGGSAQNFDDGVDLCVRYLCEFWREPCYDWWEENKEERHTSTLAAVFAGLVAASRLDGLSASVRDLAVDNADAIRTEVLELGVRDGSLVKWLGGDTCDASLLSCGVPFALVPPDGPLMRSTVQRVVHDLAHPGVHRYAADSYYGGGQWVLLSAWLGWDYALRGRREDATRQLEWVAAAANPHGELPEQVSHHLLKPDRYEEWVGRWGPVATPLLWSHAMYLTLALELGIAAAPVTPIPA